MRWTTTAVLAVLLLGLGTFYYVYDMRQGPTREKAATEKDRLWKELEAKDVEEIVVQRGGETVQLRRADGVWSLLAPMATRAETRPAEDLALSLATARREREIEASPPKLADFGLAPPAAEVTFKAKGQERGLRLGAKNPTGIWVYAQEVGKPAVFLTGESVLRDAQKGVSDFRDRTVLAFERKDVKAVEIQPPGGLALLAEPKSGDAWLLAKPLTVAGDGQRLSSLLDKLRGAKVKEFVPEPPKGPAEYGLDRPLRVTLWMGEEKERAARTIRFGKAVPDKKAVYAQREGDPTVLLVEEELVKAVPTTVADARDKSLFAYDRDRLERLELESPKGKVALALEGGSWKIVAPRTLKADDSAMNDLLARAREIRARDFVAEDGGRLATYGLDRPAVRLAVWEKDAKEPRILQLAPAKDKDLAYATAGGPVALVDARALQDLSRSVDELRDHALFGPFEARDVTRVEIQRGEVTLALERAGDEDWRLVAPRKGKARGGRVGDLVWALRNLRWKELLAETGGDAARYGLEPASATLTLRGKDGQTLAALALGRHDGERTYVRVPGAPALYAIETRSLGEVPASADELL